MEPAAHLSSRNQSKEEKVPRIHITWDWRLALSLSCPYVCYVLGSVTGTNYTPWSCSHIVTLEWQGCGEEVVLLPFILIPNCGRCHLSLLMGSQLSGDPDIICQEISLSALWIWGKEIKSYGERVHHILFSGAGKQSCEWQSSQMRGLVCMAMQNCPLPSLCMYL